MYSNVTAENNTVTAVQSSTENPGSLCSRKCHFSLPSGLATTMCIMTEQHFLTYCHVVVV